MRKNILLISGSLREKSINSALLRAAAAKIGDRAVTVTASLRDIPLYDGDIDNDNPPAAVVAFREAIERADGLLVATPEYNYSVPGVLKNAIDWASRPAYRSPLVHKKTGILGAAPGKVGTARAQSHLRQIFGGTVTPVFPHPDFLLNEAANKIDEEGNLIDGATREYLATYLDGYLAWLGS